VLSVRNMILSPDFLNCNNYFETEGVCDIETSIGKDMNVMEEVCDVSMTRRRGYNFAQRNLGFLKSLATITIWLEDQMPKPTILPSMWLSCRVKYQHV
jgi:hypothetical protein